jgi:hypothetical protein
LLTQFESEFAREQLMNNFKKEISFSNMNIVEFAGMLGAGRFLIPAFQREFIWGSQNIINLWDSIYNFYPIGSILYWDTDIHLNIHRNIGGHTILSNNKRPDHQPDKLSYILDGQQRSTALFLSLFGGKGKTKDLREFDYTLYFDAANASFFPIDEFNRRSLDVDPAFLIRLRDIPHWPPDFHRQIALKPGFKRKIGANMRQLGRAFSDYHILLTRVTGFAVKDVCEIFARINEEGKRLKSMDLLISRTFHNYTCLVEEDM